MSSDRTAFAVQRDDFYRRQQEANRQRAEMAMVAKAHIDAVKTRLQCAEDSLDLLHVGSARAILEIGMRDYQAAVEALPEV